MKVVTLSLLGALVFVASAPLPAVAAEPADFSLLRRLEPGADDGHARIVDELIGVSFELPRVWLDPRGGYSETRTHQQLALPRSARGEIRRVDRLMPSGLGTLERVASQALKDEHPTPRVLSTRDLQVAGLRARLVELETTHPEVVHRGRHVFVECPEFILHLRFSGYERHRVAGRAEDRVAFTQSIAPELDRLLAGLRRLRLGSGPSVEASPGHVLFKSHHAELKFEVPTTWVGRTPVDEQGMSSGVNFNDDKDLSLRFDSRYRKAGTETADLAAYVTHLRQQWSRTPALVLLSERDMLLNGIPVRVFGMAAGSGPARSYRRVVVIETPRNLVSLDFSAKPSRTGSKTAEELGRRANHTMATLSSLRKTNWGGGETRGFDPTIVAEPLDRSATGGGKTSGGTPPLTRVTVGPSPNSQTLRHGSEVSLTIPGGLLAESTPLTVRESRRPPPDVGGAFSRLSAWEIELGSGGPFASPVTLELTIPLAAKRPGSAMVFTWDEALSHWLRVPAEYDASRRLLRVETVHLSTWAVEEPGLYEELVVIAGSRFSVIHTGTTEDRQAVARLTKVLGEVMTEYKNAGYRMPATLATYNLIIGPDPKPQYDPLLGIIFAPRTYTNPLELKRELAHEVFHAVQNQYTNLYRMNVLRWWLEASAELAVYSHITAEGLPGPISTWPGLPLTTVDDSHEYNSASFFVWALKRADLSFKRAWDDFALGPWPEQIMRVLLESSKTFSATPEEVHLATLARLERLFSARNQERGLTADAHNELPGLYRDYVAELYLGKDVAPSLARTSAWGSHEMKTYASYEKAWPFGERSGPPTVRHERVPLPASYNAKLWVVTPEVSNAVAQRSVRVRVDLPRLPDGVEVSIYPVAGSAALTPPVRPAERLTGETVTSRAYEITAVEQLRAGKKDLEPDRLLYLLMTNTSAREQELPIFVENVRPDEPPVRHQIPGLGYTLTAPSFLLASTVSNAAVPLVLESKLPPEWTAVRVEVLPKVSTVAKARTALEQKLRDAYADVEAVGPAESIAVGEAKGELLHYRGRWKRTHKKRAFNYEGTERLPMKEGTAAVLPVEIFALVAAYGEKSLIVRAHGAPYDAPLLRAVATSLAPSSESGAWLRHAVTGSPCSLAAPASFAVSTNAPGAHLTLAGEAGWPRVEVVAAPRESTTGDLETLFVERTARLDVSLKKQLTLGNQAVAGTTVKYALHQAESAPQAGLPLEAQALFFVKDELRVLAWAVGGPGHRALLKSVLTSLDSGQLHSFAVNEQTFTLSAPARFQRVEEPNHVLVLAESEHRGVHVVATPCATEPEMMSFVEGAWQKRVPGLQQVADERWPLLGTKALAHRHEYNENGVRYAIWVVAFVRKNTRFVMFAVGEATDAKTLAALLSSLSGPSTEVTGLGGTWEGVMDLAGESGPTQLRVQIGGAVGVGRLTLRESGAGRQTGNLHLPAVPYTDFGETKEGLQVIATQGETAVVFQTSAVCIDLRNGRDDSAMEGLVRISVPGQLPFTGQWQLRRVQRP